VTHGAGTASGPGGPSSAQVITLRAAKYGCVECSRLRNGRVGVNALSIQQHYVSIGRRVDALTFKVSELQSEVASIRRDLQTLLQIVRSAEQARQAKGGATTSTEAQEH